MSMQRMAGKRSSNITSVYKLHSTYTNTHIQEVDLYLFKPTGWPSATKINKAITNYWIVWYTPVNVYLYRAMEKIKEVNK